MSGILDVFTYVFKPKDEGVEKKLGDIEKKSKDAKVATEGVSKSFDEFGKEARNAIESIVPGADKLIDNLKKIGDAMKRARTGGSTTKPSTPGTPGGGGTSPPKPGANEAPKPPSPTPTAAGEGGAALGALTIAAGLAAVAVAVLTDAFIEGARDLTESRKKAQEAGINSTQQAAAEQFAKSLRLNKGDIQNTLKTIADKTREGWVTSKTFGNIFGIGNEQTQLLKRHGIGVSDRQGNLRNSAAIFDDITRKMQTMSRETAIGFGQFFGMTKDMATAIRDSGMTFSQYAKAHQAEIQAQAKAIDQARAYEQAQQNLSNKWDDFKVKIGGALIPKITSLLEVVGNTTDEITKLSTVFRGLWETIKPIVDGLGRFATQDVVSDFDKSHPGLIKPGKGSGSSAMSWFKNLFSDTKSYYAQKGADAQHQDKLNDFSKSLGSEAAKRLTASELEKKLADREASERADYMKKVNQQTSENSSAARTQLEAANLMKVATNRFGLTTEQYFAMWAAKSGQAGGLRASGGVTPEQFQDIYKNAHAKYAPNAEWAAALYGRGAPMMAQLPNQYVTGMGINPFSGPTHAIGLNNLKAAQNAVNDSNFAVPQRQSNGKTTNIEVNTGPITIQTNSSDPNEVKNALGSHLSDQLKYTLGKLNDGQMA